MTVTSESVKPLIELEYQPPRGLVGILEWLVILLIALFWLTGLGILGCFGWWDLTEGLHERSSPLKGVWILLPLVILGYILFFWSVIGAYRIHQRTVIRLRYVPGQIDFQLRDWNIWFTRKIADISRLHSHPPERRHMGNHYLRFKDGDWIGLNPRSTHLAELIAAIDKERGRKPE